MSKLKRKIGSLFLSFIILFGMSSLFMPQIVKSGITVYASGSSFDSATRINVNTDYKDYISDSYDSDYFRFTLSSDSKVNLKLSHSYIDNSYKYWEAHIYKDDNENTEVFNSYFEGDMKTQYSNNIGLPKGDYYLLIESSYHFSDLQYTFSVNAQAVSNWEKEVNDSFDTATPVYPNRYFCGSIWDDDDTDYYKFNLTSDSKVNITFKHDYIDSSYYYWHVRLYKDDNEYTKTLDYLFTGNAKSDSTCNIGLPKGTYYVRVDSSYYYSDIDYGITVNAVSTQNWEKEVNDVFESATSIKLNSEYKGTLYTDDDTDFYRFTISGNKSVKIAFNHDRVDNSYSYWDVELYKQDNTNSLIAEWTYAGNVTSHTSNSIPLKSGVYYLRVDCSYHYSDNDYGIKVISPESAPQKKLTNNSTVSAKKITLGQSVTVNCKASGGTAPYKYSVLYKKTTGSRWTTLVSNTTNTSVKFKPKAAVTYNVKIIAKDSRGNSSSKIINVTAVKPLTNTSTLSAQSVRVKQSVKVRCNANGGTGGYTYSVYYKKASAKAYKRLRDYSSSNTVLFRPAAAVKYNFKVKVKDSSGKIVSKVLTLKVTK